MRAFCFDRIGPFRFIGDLGSADEPPRAVKEAVFRLTEYYCAVDDVPASERPLSKFKASAETFSDDGGSQPS